MVGTALTPILKATELGLDPNLETGGALVSSLAPTLMLIPPPAGPIAAGVAAIAGSLMTIFG